MTVPYAQSVELVFPYSRTAVAKTAQLLIQTALDVTITCAPSAKVAGKSFKVKVTVFQKSCESRQN